MASSCPAGGTVRSGPVVDLTGAEPGVPDDTTAPTSPDTRPDTTPDTEPDTVPTADGPPAAPVRNVPEQGVYNWDPGAHFGLYMPDTFWFDNPDRRETEQPATAAAK